MGRESTVSPPRLTDVRPQPIARLAGVELDPPDPIQQLRVSGNEQLRRRRGLLGG
jgi:hypothetical protein